VKGLEVVGNQISGTMPEGLKETTKIRSLGRDSGVSRAQSSSVDREFSGLIPRYGRTQTYKYDVLFEIVYKMNLIFFHNIYR
jgi:hypothetical protein